MIRYFITWLILEVFISHRFCQTLPQLNVLLLPNEFIGGQKGQILCINTEERSVKFHWLKDGASYPLTNSTNVKQADETTTSRLSFESLEASHSGNYTCLVQSGGRTAKGSVSVYIKVSPRWLIEPQDTVVQEDTTIVLNCGATGYPKPIITWIKINGPNEHVPVRHVEHATVTANDSLIISPALKSHSGFYTCQAQSGYGDDLRKLVKLTVYVPPKVRTSVTSKTAESGGSVSLSCDALGDRPLRVIWLKNNESVNEWSSRYHRYEIKETVKQTTISSVLLIKQVEKSDEGVFLCRVENDYGHDQSNIKLIVLERPHHPIGVAVDKIWSRSIKIVWKTSSGSYNKALEFIAEYWSISDPEGVHENMTVSGSNTWCIINNLQPATNYRVQLWAKNNIGVSQPSEQVIFTTGNEEPSAPPRDFHLEEVGANYAQLSWRPPPHRKWNGQLTGFYIGYKLSSYSGVFSYYTIALEGDVHSFVLRSLRKSSSYSVIVKAFNSIGSGPSTEELVFRTKDDNLTPKPDLFIETWSPTSLELRWTIREMENIISGFTISYRKEGHQWKEITIPSGLERKFSLTDLENDQLYHIFIVANSNFGNSEPSEIATIRTTSVGLYEDKNNKDRSPPEWNKQDKEKTQLMYIIIPVCVAVVVIVIVIAVACLYVYSKNSAVPVPTPYMPCIKDTFVYTPSLPLRHCQGMLTPHPSELSFKHSPYSTMPLTEFDRGEEEPIYESVMDEMRNTMKWREKELELKSQELELKSQRV